MSSLNAVFSENRFRSHMPFFDGETLLFCRSNDATHRHFRRGGSLQRRALRDRHLMSGTYMLETIAPNTAAQYSAWNDNAAKSTFMYIQEITMANAQSYSLDSFITNPSHPSQSLAQYFGVPGVAETFRKNGTWRLIETSYASFIGKITLLPKG